MEMQFGQFIPDNTFVHKLDPRSKIISLTILVISIFLVPRKELFIFISLLLLFLIGISKISFKNILKGIKPLVVMFLFLLAINILIIKEGNLLLTIPLVNTKIYDGAIFQTLFIFWRVVMIVVMSIILTTTTNPLSLTLGLEKLCKPLAKIGVPVEVFAMMISISLRFIPTIFDEVNKITNAQASRGLDFQNGKFNEKIKALIALVIPLLVSSFNKADELALSMESKNYNPEVSRPRYRQIYLSSSDWFVLILGHGYLIAIIYWKARF